MWKFCGSFDTNGELSLDKLKENVSHIGTYENTEKFPLKVKVDDYDFEVTFKGDIQDDNIEVGDSGESGSLEMLPEEVKKYIEQELQKVKKEAVEQAREEAKKELQEKMQILETGLEEETQKNSEQEDQINKNASDIAKLTSWNKKQVNTKIQVAAWTTNNVNIPELKNAKKAILVLEDSFTFYAENTQDGLMVTIPMDLGRGSSDSGYMKGWINVHFSSGLIDLRITDYGSFWTSNQLTISRVYYI